MTSLQYRIALILGASIVAVVVAATVLTAFVVSSTDNARMIEPMAQHIAFSTDFLESWVPRDIYGPAPGGRMPGPPPDMTKVPNLPAKSLPPPPDFGGERGGPMRHERVAAAPAVGAPREDLTASLKSALAKLRIGTDVVVSENEARELTASYKLANGHWAQFGFPRSMPPPASLWLALTVWMAAIVLGVGALALVMARRVTQPFNILERAVSSVGPDGILPHIPEKTGSGEARHTAVVLNRLSERLRESMESRMRLVAAAGHDLRTPMARMRLRAEFLPEEDRASWIGDLDELEQMADSAIHLVREEGTSEDQTRIDLDALVLETIAELTLAKLPVRLEEASPAIVMAAPLSLRRALRNLFTNAATHGGGGIIRLLADERHAQVIIDDDGPGIPSELMGQMFEPFFRVDPARGKPTKGAGLGLAIAKDIIQRFGGTIEIHNRPEGGLRQVLTLDRVLGGSVRS